MGFSNNIQEHVYLPTSFFEGGGGEGEEARGTERRNKKLSIYSLKLPCSLNNFGFFINSCQTCQITLGTAKQFLNIHKPQQNSEVP